MKRAIAVVLALMLVCLMPLAMAQTSPLRSYCPNTAVLDSITSLATPSAPTVTPTCSGTCASTQAYKIVAKNAIGVSIASSAGQTTAQAATVDVTHFNTITGVAVTGATSYDIYRTTATTPSTTGKIGTVTDITVGLVDNGLAGDSASAPTANTSAARTKIVSGNSALTSTIFSPTGVTGTSTQASPRVRLCNVAIRVNQTTTKADFGLVSGTGAAACGSNTTNITPQWTGTVSVIDKFELNYGADGALAVKPGHDVCLKLSFLPTGAQVLLSYGYY